MLDLFLIIISSVVAIASPASPNQPNYVYKAEAKTNTLASSVLAVEIVPETPSPIIVPDEIEGENWERDDFDITEGLKLTTVRGNGLDEVRQDPSKQEIVKMIKKEFPDEPLAVKIADCESIGLRHYVKGEVLRGEQVKEDLGLFQINETYWLEKSRKLGIDIYDLEGNITFAKWLYNRQGTKPWNSSRFCWQ